jgi:hypothetical protein
VLVQQIHHIFVSLKIVGREKETCKSKRKINTKVHVKGWNTKKKKEQTKK